MFIILKYFRNFCIFDFIIIFEKRNNNYFNEWLSGFIEAEGCFSIRTTSNNHSFSIAQNDDKYILDKIKHHFNITNKIWIL